MKYKFTQEQMSTMDLSYLDLSYAIIDKEDDKILILNQLITPCRDSFLVDVDRLLRTGAKETLTIALFVKTNSLALPYLGTGITQIINAICALHRNLAITHSIVGYKTTEYNMFTFEISKYNYYSPCSFWLLTEHIRKALTTFSKVDYTNNEHTSYNYTALCYFIGNLDPAKMPPFIINPACQYREFLYVNSPAGALWLINSMVGVILFGNYENDLIASRTYITFKEHCLPWMNNMSILFGQIRVPVSTIVKLYAAISNKPEVK